MKLKCPACGAPIPAAAINVQQMVAVCPECDNVFKFEGAFRQQRRKLKAPAQFQVVDDDPDRLDMAFKWSWRTEPPVGLFGVIMGLLIPLIVYRMAERGGGARPLLPAADCPDELYVLLTLVLNRTHYESDGETLQVYTEPLPFFRYGRTTVAVDEIDHVSVERPTRAFPRRQRRLLRRLRPHARRRQTEGRRHRQPPARPFHRAGDRGVTASAAGNARASDR